MDFRFSYIRYSIEEQGKSYCLNHSRTTVNIGHPHVFDI